MAKEQFELYNKEVILVTDTEAERSRYRVWDKKNGKDNEPVRGVTTVLGNVFDKPGLRMYPLNEAMKYLFGAKWDDVLKQHIANKDNANLRPKVLEQHLADNDIDTYYQYLLDQCYAVSKDKATKGKDIGKLIHSAIETGLKYADKGFTADTFLLPKDISEEDEKSFLKAVGAFKEWFNKVKPIVIKVEQPVYSRLYGYAGRLDCLLEIDGKIHLCDIKTTNASNYALKAKDKSWTGIYPDNFLQMGAYVSAYHEEKRYVKSQKAGADYPLPLIGKQKAQDLTVINVTKAGQLQTISASELGLTVERLDNAAQATMKLHNLLSDMYKVRPLNVWQEVEAKA